MPSHFSSIGVPGRADAVMEAVRHAATHGSVTTTAGGDRLLEWTDAASGASIAVSIGRSGRVDCAKPYVLPTGRPARARIESLVEDTGCLNCSLLMVQVLYDGSEDTAYPLAVELPDLAAVLPTLVPGQPVGLQLSGIAESVDLFVDEAAYRDSGTPFAMRSLVPSGLFTPGLAPEDDPRPPRAEALFSGVVLTASLRRNSLFGEPFWHVLVDTLEAQVDLAIDAEMLDAEPAPGSVCSATAWLLGRLTAR